MPSVRNVHLSHLMLPDSLQGQRADLGVSPGPALSISGTAWKSPNPVNVDFSVLVSKIEGGSPPRIVT